MNTPQIKICGLTTAEQAYSCAKLGADAIGVVFYAKSPRYVTVRQAAKIAEKINGLAVPVAVTVDMELDEILQIAVTSGITAFQLHGNESPEYVLRLRQAGLRVIKHLNACADALIEAAERYSGVSFIAECGRGAMPGGNGIEWDWAAAKTLAGLRPFAVAGGLDCDNVKEALRASSADAADASSSLEKQSGIKDMDKVEKFIEQVRQVSLDREIMRIF